MTEIRRSASEPTTEQPVVVRPRFVVAVASLVSMLGVAVWAVGAAWSRPTLGTIAAAVLFTAMAAWVLAAASCQRVEVDGATARIVRVVTTDAVDRADVLAVHQVGGRGRPAFIRLRDGIETTAPSLDATRWPPRVRRQTGVAATPSFLTSRRIAAALDVPLRSWSGGDPSPPLHVALRDIWHEGSTTTGVVAVLLVVAVGTAAAAILLTSV